MDEIISKLENIRITEPAEPIPIPEVPTEIAELIERSVQIRREAEAAEIAQLIERSVQVRREVEVAEQAAMARVDCEKLLGIATAKYLNAEELAKLALVSKEVRRQVQPKLNEKKKEMSGYIR